MKNSISFILLFFVLTGSAQVAVEIVATDESTEDSILKFDIYKSSDQSVHPSNENGKVVMIIEDGDKEELIFFSENYDITNFEIISDSDTTIVLRPARLSVELSSIEIAARRDELFSLKQLKDVEGTAIFAGKKTEVILLDKIKANLATNNAREIYAQIAGLNIYEGSNGGIQLGIGGRGLDPNRTSNFNTRQNGYDISADVLGYPENYYTPPSEAIDEIQVIRGASSLQYGTQFGGLINFKLKDITKEEGWSLLTRQTYGSFDLFNTYNQIGFRNNKLKINSSFNYKRGNGYRPNSDFESINFFTTINYKLNDKLSIDGELTYFNYLAKQAGGLTDDQFKINPQQSTRERNWFDVDWLLYSLKLNYQFNSSEKLSLNFFGLNAARSSVGYRGNPINLNENPITSIDEQDSQGRFISPRDLILGEFNNWGLEGRYLKRFKISDKNSVFLIGGKYYGSNNTSIQGPGSDGIDADFNLYADQFPDYANQSDFDLPNQNLSLFVEHILYFNPQFSIVPGFRLEHIKTGSEGTFNRVIFDNAGNPLSNQLFEDNRTIERTFGLLGLGFNYKKLKDKTIYANISQNYRSVTFSDIRVVNPSFIVDPDIGDEQGLTADIGIRGRVGKKVSFDAGIYTIQYQDRIGTILDDRANRVRKNIGNASIVGIETFADFNLTNILSSEVKNYTLKWFGNLAYTQSKYTSSEELNVVSKKVEFVPEINVKTGLNYKVSNLSSSIQYTYLSEQFTDAQNSQSAVNGDSRSGIIGTIPSYAIMDFNLTYTFEALEISAGINNLFNESYFTRRATGYPGPGIIPSDGRSIYLTISYEL